MDHLTPWAWKYIALWTEINILLIVLLSPKLHFFIIPYCLAKSKIKLCDNLVLSTVASFAIYRESLTLLLLGPGRHRYIYQVQCSILISLQDLLGLLLLWLVFHPLLMLTQTQFGTDFLLAVFDWLEIESWNQIHKWSFSFLQPGKIYNFVKICLNNWILCKSNIENIKEINIL